MNSCSRKNQEQNLVGIHQPNFLPWLGYFTKISKSDIFVFLDDVEVQKTGGSYVNRVAVNSAGKAKWLTVPILRNAGKSVEIRAIEAADEEWFMEIIRKIRILYGEEEYFNEVESLLLSAHEQSGNNLSSFNIEFIQCCAVLLGLGRTQFILASRLEIATTATQRLIDICTALGCKSYISGDGADGYQDTSAMFEAGINVEFLNYQQPMYHQNLGQDFLKGLSIIDCIANIGIFATRQLITK